MEVWTVMTNIEYLRKCTPEEFAEWIDNKIAIEITFAREDNKTDRVNELVDWLNSETVVEDNSRIRSIIFRGVCVGNKNKTVYGSLVVYNNRPAILSLNDNKMYIVDPDSVGQCTGKKDRNGKDIFENDILLRDDPQFPLKGHVVYHDGAFWFNDEEMGFYEYPLYELQTKNFTIL